MNRYKAYVYGGGKIAPGQRVWHFQVRDEEGRLMAYDNTGDWRTIYDDALRVTRALHEFEVRGFDLQQPEWLRGFDTGAPRVRRTRIDI